MTEKPVTQEKKKRAGPLVWVLVGCLGILVLGAIAAFVGGVFIFNKAKEVVGDFDENPTLAAAKLIAATNPEIELVGTDEDSQSVTFRNTQTDEEFTFNYEDIQQGKVTFSSGDQSVTIDAPTGKEDQNTMTITTDQGNVTLGAGAGAQGFPDWLPIYPGTTPQGAYSTDSAQVRAGAYTIKTTKNNLEKVLDYYTTKFEEAGLKISGRTNLPGSTLLTAQSSNGSKTASVTSVFEKEEVRVMVNFTEKKR